MRCWKWRMASLALLSAMGLPASRVLAQNESTSSVRLPQTQAAADDSSTVARLPAVTPVSNARVMSLEARLAELEAKAASTSSDDKAPEKKKDNVGLKKVDILVKPTFKIGGRIFVDQLMAGQSPLNTATYGDVQNRTRFRTARLSVEGDVFENIDYKIEFAVASENADVVAKDIYMTVKDLPTIGSIRIGYFREPFSLDELISSNYNTFMERSLMDVFAPARNLGIMSTIQLREDETLTVYNGLFRSETSNPPVDASADNGDWAYTARIAGNPSYDEPTEGRYLTHLGGCYSYRRYADGNVTFTKVPELTFNNYLIINLTNQPTDSIHEFNSEAAFSAGPWHGETEWTFVHLNGLGANPSGNFNGGYILTGENRGYKKDAHVFDRVKVLEPVFAVRTCDGICRGWGAWEVKARISFVDANSVGTFGGRATDYSTGFNWYLNSYCRMMFDYVYSNSSSQPAAAAGIAGSGGGSSSLVGMRAQVDW
jgi:phosphate-selective porin OprO/OprP